MPPSGRARPRNLAEYRLTPAAQRELDGVFDYSVAQWGLSQAQHYVDQLMACCSDLAEAPLLASACDHIRPDYRRRSIAQHVIYFRRTRYGIAIIRILHHRMDSGRHI